MRLESLDLDHREQAHAELAELAEEFRASGWTAEIAGLDEATWSRLRESAAHAFVDVLNLVLDETERHFVDAAIGLITSWAIHRRYFAGRGGARPVVAVWIDGDIVRTVPLPDSRYDIVVQVEVATLAEGKALERAMNEVLPLGDGIRMTPAGEVLGVHLQSGLAEIRGDGEEQAIATLRAAFATQNMVVAQQGRSPGGEAPLLVFVPADPPSAE